MTLHGVPAVFMRQQTLQTVLQEDMRNLLLSAEHTDLSFILNNHPIPIHVHSSVIAARCHALRNTILRFREQHKNHPHGQSAHPVLEVSVEAASEISFRKVLEYIYTGVISLEATDIFDVCTLAAFLGVPSLQNIVFCYLRNEDNLPLLTTALDRALGHVNNNRLLLTKLTEYFAENASKALKNAPFHELSQNLMKHIVKQENLAASELEIWNALIKWSCYRAGIISPKKVSEMEQHERHLISKHMRTFCRPGLVRILNFDAMAFAEEVEPLEVFTISEILLKYRFDAAAGNAAFDYAFPRDRYSFLLRIRQRTMCFESTSHPHPRGVSQVAKVELPKWVTEITVTFDERTALGRYSDLEFFLDEHRTASIFSVRSSRQYGLDNSSICVAAPARYSGKTMTLGPLSIAGNCFWYTFYAPQNVGDLAWGYKFYVSIVR